MLNNTVKTPEKIKNTTNSGQSSKLLAWMQTLSLRTSWNALVSPSVKETTSIFNGLRFISMLWIIYGHTYESRLLFPVQNPEQIIPVIQSPGAAISGLAFFAVDIFYWMGGFLLGYLTLKELRARKKIPWGTAIFLRFLRLMPPMLLVIGITYLIVPGVVTGPFMHLTDNVVR